ncbi:MAG TPA: hypothetical protein VM938_07220 [Acidimicrobiales bacterium]|nr:hypothetical protein [Acidimicrobiales bacterium]
MTAPQLLPVPDALPAPENDVGVVAGADILDALADHHHTSGDEDGGEVPTGIPVLDGSGGGLALGTATIAVDRPGSRGPTRLLLRAALHAAGRERPTLFCALDLPRLSFARALAAAVTEVDEHRRVSERALDEEALRAAATELRRRPLFVVAGETLTTFDLLAMADAKLVEFVVVDNYGLLLPDGSASDLKRCAVDLHAAVLASITLAGGGDGALDVRALGPGLVSGADTVVAPESDDWRVLVTRTHPGID